MKEKKTKCVSDFSDNIFLTQPSQQIGESEGKTFIIYIKAQMFPTP